MRNKIIVFILMSTGIFLHAAESELTSELDIAPFGKMMTWDPEQQRAYPPTLDEFPESDLFLGSEVLSDANGMYIVPQYENGKGCIGVEWNEPRAIKEIVLKFDLKLTNPSDIRLEYWTELPDGRVWEFVNSRWQGQWKTLKATLEIAEGQLIYSIDPDNFSMERFDIYPLPPLPGTIKIRCILPSGSMPARLHGINVLSCSVWEQVELRIEWEDELSDEKAKLEIYNGTISVGGEPQTTTTIIPAQPISIELLALVADQSKADETILWFRLPKAAFGVAVRDVLDKGPVYVPHAGVFVTKADDEMDLAAYKTIIEEKTSILDEVRSMPDQSLTQAMTVHPKEAQRSPTMLSLSCHNWKYIVEKDGTLLVPLAGWTGDHLRGISVPSKIAVTPVFSNGKENSEIPELSRYLEGGWYPIQIIEQRQGSMIYKQRSFTAPIMKDEGSRFEQSALFVSEFSIENIEERPKETHLEMAFNYRSPNPNRYTEYPFAIQWDDSNIYGVYDGRIVLYLETSGLNLLSVEIEDNRVSIDGTINAKERATCVLYAPEWGAKIDECRTFLDTDELCFATRNYWDEIMADGIQLNLPDQEFVNIIQSSRVNCLIAARREGDEFVSPWVAAGMYGPVDHEAQIIIKAMDWWGHEKFAKDALAFFQNSIGEKGFFTTGWTTTAIAWHLWLLAEHFDITGDKAWLESLAPSIIKSCKWITKELEKTKRLDYKGDKLPEYGLFTPSVSGDWRQLNYKYYVQARLYAGLKESARVLAEIENPAAEEIGKEAEEFRHNILRAYRWTQSRCPVVPLRNGTWVPYSPSIVYAFGMVSDIFPAGHRGAWAYDIEHGSQYLFDLDILTADGEGADWLVNHYEDVCFQLSGYGCKGHYTESQNWDEWFNRGGFSKYMWSLSSTVEIYAMRDEVKPLIRSVFNQIAMSLDTENLTFWEHGVGAAWNKTHGTGRILEQIRMMLVLEKKDDLWLAPFMPNHYMHDGLRVEINRAPTHFGEVSYVIRSFVNNGYIDAEINPPKRKMPAGIVIRLRHPEGKRIKSVTVNGKPHTDFNPKKETVRIKLSEDKQIYVKAEF